MVCVRCFLGSRRGISLREIFATEGVLWGIFALVIAFVLPRVELTNLDGEPVGMAIRGYGVMLLLAIASAVGLAAYRAKRRGMDPEIILGMAPWAFLGGIAGARIFFVIQYRDQFLVGSWRETLSRMLDFTGGGLVVYGSFIGGFSSRSILRVSTPSKSPEDRGHYYPLPFSGCIPGAYGLSL